MFKQQFCIDSLAVPTSVGLKAIPTVFPLSYEFSILELQREELSMNISST